MKFLKKLFKYLGVVVALVACVAGVKVASFLLNKPADEEQVEPSGQEEESALTKVFDKFLQMENGVFDLNFDIFTPADEITVDASVVLDMGSSSVSPASYAPTAFSVDALALTVEGSFEMKQEVIEFSISYTDGYLYADIAGIKVKTKTENALTDIQTILGLGLFEKVGFDIALPDISLDSFDTSMLVELTQNIVEEEIDGGNKISLNLFGYGTVALYTDEEYNPNKVVIESLSIEGIDIAGGINTKLNTEIQPIFAPTNSDEMTDISSIGSVMTTVDALIHKGVIVGEVDLDVEGTEFNGKYEIDFQDFNDITAYFETMIASQKLIISYKSGKVYISYDDYKYYVELESFDINTILAKVNAVASTFEYGLPKIDFGGFDPSTLKLEQLFGLTAFIGGITLSEDEVSFAVEDALVRFTIKGQEFDKLEVSYFDIVNATVTFNESFEKEQINYSEYFGIEILEKKLNAIVSQLKEKKVGTEVTIKSGGTEYQARVYVDLNKGLEAKIEFSYSGYDIEAIYENGYIYMNANGLKLKYLIPEAVDLNEVLDYAIGLIPEVVPGFEVPELSITELESELSKVDIISLMKLASGVEFRIKNASNENVELEVEGVSFILDLTSEKIANVSFGYETYGLNLEILSNDFEITPEGKYVEINDALDYVPAVIDLINSKKLLITTTIEVSEVEIGVKARVDFTEAIKVEAVLNISGEEVKVYYVDGTLYVEYKTIYVKGTVEELRSLVGGSDAEMPTASEQLSLDILEDITRSEDLLNVVLKLGLTITLEKTGEELTGLEFAYSDYEIAFEVSKFEEEIVYVEKEEYLSATELIDFAQVMLNYIQGEELNLAIEFNYDDLIVEGKISLAGEKVKAIFETTIMDRILQIMLKDEQIYLDFDGLRITCKLENINDLVDYVTDFIGVEVTATTMPEPTLNVAEIINALIIDLTNGVMTISYEDFDISIDTANGSFNGISGTYENINAKIVPCDSFDFKLVGNYIDLYDIKELSRAVYNTLKNLSVSGTIEVTLNLFGEDNLLSIDYAIGYIDEKIIGYIETEFKGLDVNVYIDGEDIYIYVVGLRIHFNINDREELVDWVNSTFNANLTLDFIDDAMDSIENMKLDLVTEVKHEDDITKVMLKNGMSIEVVFDDYVRTVYFKDGSREAILTCTAFNLINFDGLNKEEYKDYTEFTGLIKEVYNFAMSSQFDVTGTAKVYNGDLLSHNISGAIQLDVTNGLNAFIDVFGLGEEITVYYQNKVLYFCYGGENGLKLSINEGAVQEIAAIMLSAFNIDTSSIPYLDEILKKENIDTSNLGSIMPDISIGNPLSYLEYVNTFEVKDETESEEGYFGINIKGDMISDLAKGKDVSIKIYFKAEKLTAIEINNLFINEKEHFNLKLDLNAFEKVTEVADTNKYIDISGSSDLLKALINTSFLDDYHINGKIKLSIALGSASINAAAINVDAKVKKYEITNTRYDEATGEFIEETTFDIVGIITLDNYPLIGLINGKNTNGVGGITSGTMRYRKITIVLKGGYAYLKTSDKEWGLYEQLDRATKVTTDYLLNNIEYYMQYLLGFTDTIQTKIVETLEASRNYTGEVKYGEMVSKYTHVGREHTIVLNMSEIAHNGDIGDMTIKLTTISNDATENKDYLYRLDLDLQLFDGMLALRTDTSSSTDAIFLVDIGQTVSTQEMDAFVSEYDITYCLGVDGEYKREDLGSWQQENSGTSTVTFYSQGSVYAESTGAIASALTLPVPERVEDDGLTKKTYKFEGWFTDENYSTQFTSEFYPRYSTSLFAKWTLVSEKKYVTVTFVTNEESLSAVAKKSLEGDVLELPVYENVELESTQNVSRLKIFLGWYTDEACTTKFTGTTYPTENCTLYAGWRVEVTTTYNLQILFNDESKYNTGVPGDVELDLAILEMYDEFYDFETNTKITEFVVTKDSIWVAKNYYTVTAISEKGKDGPYTSGNRSILNGSSFSLQSFANYTEDKGTYFIEHKFLGYYLNGDTNTLYSGTAITPTCDASYVAVWQSKEYCTITFDTTWAKPSSWVDETYNASLNPFRPQYVPRIVCTKSVNTVAQLVVERNVAFDPLAVRTATCTYTYHYAFDGTYNFFVGRWKTEEGATCAFSATPIDGKDYSQAKITVSQHTTLYPHWDATMN